MLRLRNKLLPLVRLKRLLKLDAGADSEPENGFIVVTQVGSQTFGIVVDGVFHTEEIVVKPMSTKLRHIAMFSGNTILGDGSVIMILDPNGIAAGSVGSSPRDGGTRRWRMPRHEHHAAAERHRPRCWCSAPARRSRRRCRCRWSRGSRRSTPRRSSMSNGRHLVQYRGQLMPLVRVNDDVAIKTEGAQPLLVFSDDGRSMGLVVDEIVDIVEDRLDIEVGSDTPGRARLGRHQGPGDRDHRRRPLPAARLRGLVRAARSMQPSAPARIAAAGRRLAPSSATC